jgi:hypothetical protein
MLTHIRLQNFRCFDDHTIPLRRRTVVVGKNNAGKSTLVDALRIVSIVSGRLRTMTFRKPPAWTELPVREVGIGPSLAGIEFNSENLFHRYGDAPAVITATFASLASLKILIGEDALVHAVLLDGNGVVVSTRAKLEGLGVGGVEIMPQVGPLERSESLLNPDYVRRNVSSALASRHFRNQLHLLSNSFTAFKELSQETWPGLQVRDLNLGQNGDKMEFSLLVRANDYVTEVATMGHGLQMWLQTMWFLSRVSERAIVILDEPDVYMHPDLQRRLMRYLLRRENQVVVTTHSVEIMAEVEPEDILILDRQRRSAFAGSFPAVQRVLDHVGSAHNLQLAKLWHARKCVLVEGGDFGLLSDFFDVLYAADQDGLADTPHMSIGGWNGFANALGSSMLLRNAGGEEIAVFCILDSDYHTDQQIGRKYKQAREAGVRLHVWRRKEIENYLLIPSAIHRAIVGRLAKRTQGPTLDEVEVELCRVIEGLEDEVFDGLAGEIALDDRSLGLAKTNKAARLEFRRRWADPAARASVVPGKYVLSQVARWSQDQFGVSLNAGLVARSMRPEEVPNEMQLVLEVIATGRAFPPDIREENASGES